MIFTIFGITILIQTVQLQNAQTAFKMKEKDRVNILIKFFFLFLLKIWKNLELRNLFFQVGLEIDPHKGLIGIFLSVPSIS